MPRLFPSFQNAPSTPGRPTREIKLLPARQVIGWAIFCALGSAALQNIVRFVRYYVFLPPLPPNHHDYLATLPPDVYWMPPVSQLLLLLALGAALTILSLGFRRLRRPRNVALVFGSVMAIDLSFLIGGSRIHLAALLLLAVGIAVALSRQVEKRSFFANPPWALSLALAIVLTAWGVTALAWRQAREWSASASLPEPPRKPNVLFITLDTVRKRNLSLYGYQRPTTPSLERFAPEAVVFSNAYAPSNWTLPTHASLFTGRLPFELGADFDTPLDDRYPTLAEQFRQAGYATGGFAGNTGYCGGETGLGRGFDHYAAFPSKPALLLKTSFTMLVMSEVLFQLHGVSRTAADINYDVLRWQARQTQRPFFAFVNYYDAHFPYELPETRFDAFATIPPAQRQAFLDEWRNHWEWSTTDPVELQFAVDRYDALIRYTDYYLGRLLDELDRRGALDNTIVVVTNDHGEHFGEHDQWGHGGQSMYRELIEAPLFVMHRGQLPAGRVVDAPVNTLELAATVCDLAGIPAPATFRGKTLRRHWESTSPTDRDEEVIVSDAQLSPTDESVAVRSLIANGFHYIYDTGERRELLFRTQADPLEKQDQKDSPEGQRELAFFRQQYQSIWQSIPSPKTQNAARPAPPALSQFGGRPQCRCAPYESPLRHQLAHWLSFLRPRSART